MIEFFATMPTNTKIFLTMAVLGLMASLIVLRGLIWQRCLRAYVVVQTYGYHQHVPIHVGGS
jgi:hypothetical protein